MNMQTTQRSDFVHGQGCMLLCSASKTTGKFAVVLIFVVMWSAMTQDVGEPLERTIQVDTLFSI